MSKALKAVILMGVSGCGKTSVGESLSEVTGWPFYDGDDFHSESNVEKMSRGIPLDDVDRQPWLEGLHKLMVEHLSAGKSLILACSALKKTYRDILRGSYEDKVVFVYLKGSFDLILGRMQLRDEHYMKAELLQSQFVIVQEPKGALTIDIRKNVSDIVEEIEEKINNPSDKEGDQ